jgi:hypothetical protein
MVSTKSWLWLDTTKKTGDELMVNNVYTTIMLALVGLVLTAQTAFATNESSYQWGYKGGFGSYHCFISGPPKHEDRQCQRPGGEDFICYSLPLLLNGTGYSTVTISNQTACHDGYVNGWKDWCKSDVANCSMLETFGVYPPGTMPSRLLSLNGSTWNIDVVPTLAYNVGHSKVWNQGYSDGYLGQAPPNEMSKDYWHGYANGTNAFEWNKGFTEGSSNKTEDWHQTSDSYRRGYDLGKENADPKCQDDCNIAVLPNATSDNYMQFYIGYDNGMAAEDFDNAHNGDTGLEPHPSHERYHSSGQCASGFHTDEYCAGYEQGWNIESDNND